LKRPHRRQDDRHRNHLEHNDHNCPCRSSPSPHHERSRDRQENDEAEGNPGQSNPYGIEHSEPICDESGILDIFLGLSVLWIGAAWLWFPDISGMTVVFLGILLAFALVVQKRVVSGRRCHVEWSETRSHRGHSGTVVVVSVGALVFVLGVGAFVAVSQQASDTSLVEALIPGLPALLLAVVAIAVGLATGIRRAFVYAAILGISGLFTIWGGGDPGLDMFVAGSIIAIIGATMLATFLHRYPRRPPGEQQRRERY
jgi:hypothetical protein